MVVQARELSAGDFAKMQGPLAEYPEWGRTWGRLPGNGLPPTDSATEPIHGILHDLPPLSLSIAAPSSADRRRFDGPLAGYHSPGPTHHRRRKPGVSGPVGAASGSAPAVVGPLAGYHSPGPPHHSGRAPGVSGPQASAWKCAGWDRRTRARSLQWLTHNLASHLLSLIARRIAAGWLRRPRKLTPGPPAGGDDDALPVNGLAAAPLRPGWRRGRPSRVCVGDVRGPRALSERLLPGGPRVAARRVPGTHAQRPCTASTRRSGTCIFIGSPPASDRDCAIDDADGSAHRLHVAGMPTVPSGPHGSGRTAATHSGEGRFDSSRTPGIENPEFEVPGSTEAVSRRDRRWRRFSRSWRHVSAWGRCPKAAALTPIAWKSRQPD